jgi:FKBP-type peptidyl-prolyl cis-trans isomerase FkpA
MKKIVILIILLPLFVTCKKKKTIDQPAIDKDIITSYISSHQLNAVATGSGLYYVIKTQGTGSNPAANSNVTVVYKGYFTSGGVFDQSSSTGLNINLSSVIEGWKEGIPYFKKGGGKGILLIPSALGYGSQATASIPANSVLIFDIELL